MNRAHLLMVVAALSVVACQDQQPVAPIATNGPVFQISDGHNGGNSGFFFLFPIRRLADDATIPATGFNPDLAPVIEVYECAGTSATGCVPPLGALKSRITKTSGTPLLNRLYVLPRLREYQALWDTRGIGLRADRTYRIQISVGGAVLGFADVDVVRTIKEAARVNRDDFVPLLENLILPIRFWLGNNALCNGAACASKTINLSQGGGVELLAAGEDFKVDIPAGTSATFGGQPVANVTVNLEVCSGIDVDLPTFGQCLRLSTFFDATGQGELEFSKPVLISMCVLNSVYNTPDEQQDLITLHQQDGSLIRALPHADPNCGTIGMNRSGWDWLKSLAERFLAPTPAHAATRNALLHVGAGGETGVLGAKCGPPPEPAPGRVPGIMLTTTCPPQSPMRRSGPRGSPMATVTPPKTVSDFQFALPAKMDYLNRGDADRTAPAGTALPTAVKVTDWDGTAVQGARVTFTEPGEPDGTIIGTATSGSDGVAQILWTIKAGPNTVVASGRGIAAQNNYPNATVKPFMPDISLPTDQQRPVALGTGRVTFFATGVTGGFTPQTVLTGLEYPKGLWISHFDAYLTETAGHNTTFGGKTTLLHWTPDGRILQTLLTNPVNSDAVVVTEDGSIYLAGYVGSSPGEQGRVSRASFTGAAGWVETPVTDVAIAAQDMFLDENEDIYLIGPSDDQEATNIYRLPSGSYDSPVGLATGLGRTWSLVKIGSTIYYSLITSGEVWALSDVGNALLFTNSSAVTSLTSDGTFLYYGDIGGTIRRLNLSTGADELVTTGPGAINAVRYDPSSGRLYYLRSGTADAQYKDGTLNYITVNTPSP